MTAAIVVPGGSAFWPGERLPFTARDIHFAMTVRDNYMAAKPTNASQDLTYGSWHAAITKVNVVDLGPMLVEQPAAGASVPAGITLVTFKLDGYKNPAASPGLDDVKGAKFTFEVTTNGGLAWTDLVRSQHLVKLNNKGEGSAYVVLPTSLVGSTVAQIRVVADMAKVPGQTTTGCAFWAPSGKFTVTAARPVPTVATTQPAATANVPATISAISFGFSAPVFQRTAATPVATVAAASGTSTNITSNPRRLFEDGASAANFFDLHRRQLTFRSGFYTCSSCMADQSANAWCAAGALCATGPMETSTMLPGDRVLCPHDVWTYSSGCVASNVTDPYYETNAWAHTLINLQPAWAAGYTGAGVTINIVDDGPDETHPDFSGKYDALGSCPTHTTGSHGTTVAAIALAAGNDQCSRGVAYGATLSKCGMNGNTVTNMLIGNMARNHISSNSWGIDPCTALASSGRRKLRQRQLQGCPFAATAASGTSPCSASECPGASWTSPLSTCEAVISTYCQDVSNYDADGECASWTHLWMTCAYTHLPWATKRTLQRGVLEGRSGRGIVYVMSSGNENAQGEDVNMEQYLHSRFTITVGATDKLGLHSYYSVTGSSLFISAPGGDATQHSNSWHVAATGGGCAAQQQGTSYACPVVSGVVALMLQANPLLGWRDVQGILAATTSRNDPTSSLWTTNAAGFIHNIKYGFGMVDASAAVAAALSWTNWGIERRIIANSSQQLTVPHDGSTLSTSVTVGAQSQAWAIEWIEIFVNLNHSSRGDLQLELTSPSGTHSVLTPGPRPETSNPPVVGCSAEDDTCTSSNDGICDNPQSCECDYNDCLAANWTGTNGQPSLYLPRFNWKMTSVRSWGESPVGTWTLAIRDRRLANGPSVNSLLRSWNLLIYGHHGTASRLSSRNTSTTNTGTPSPPSPLLASPSPALSQPPSPSPSSSPPSLAPPDALGDMGSGEAPSPSHLPPLSQPPSPSPSSSPPSLAPPDALGDMGSGEAPSPSHLPPLSLPPSPSPSPRSATPVATTVKVVVVGAGTSGLAAARTLIDTWDTAANGGHLELTVLEAGTRIGGRTWTLNAAEAGTAWDTAGALGAPTDMGASWIHGSNESHPITKIATALGLAEGAGLVRTRNNLAELRLCTENQNSACSEPSDDQYNPYKSLLSQAQENSATTDISLWQALAGLSNSGQTRDSELFQYHLAVSTEFNTAGPVTNLSAWNYNDDSKFNGAELVWAQGYKQMYEALQSGAVRVNDGSSTLQVTAVLSASRQPISVTYNKRVTSVTYNSTGVVLTTADSSTYNADYVIITIPLGVLKSTDASSRVTFSPALPTATANGISQLGFGNVVKIALLFPTNWWPSGTHYYGLAQGTNRGLFTYFLNVHELSTKPVLMTFALGAAADTAEGMSDAEVWAQVRSPSLLQHTSYPSSAWA